MFKPICEHISQFALVCGLIVVSLLAPAAAETAVIDGRQLYYHCQGKSQGSEPTVILEHGMGSSSHNWTAVLNQVAKFARVCAYDRAGYGRSSPGTLPRTSSRLAAELRTFLDKARIQPPYILVGHSYGGYVARLFASLYPSLTVGLILVDTPHEDQVEGIFQNRLLRQLDPSGTLAQAWQTETISDFLNQSGPLPGLFALLPPNARTVISEASAFKESGDEVRQAQLAANIPLVIIQHGRPILASGSNPLDDSWDALQHKLLKQHPLSRFVLAKRSGHNIPVEQPGAIVEEIRRLLRR